MTTGGVIATTTVTIRRNIRAHTATTATTMTATGTRASEEITLHKSTLHKSKNSRPDYNITCECVFVLRDVNVNVIDRMIITN